MYCSTALFVLLELILALISAASELSKASYTIAVGRFIKKLGRNALLVHLALLRTFASPAGELSEAGDAMPVGGLLVLES